MFNRALLILFFLIQLVLVFYMLAPFFLLVFNALFRISRKKWEKRHPVVHDRDFNFAAIITAHQDERFIPPLVDSLLRQTYRNYMIYVVADDCDISSLSFSDPRVVILRPAEPLHAKIRSIQYAIDHFKSAHDVLMVFDSDNLVHPRCIEVLHEYFRRGYSAVQAHMLSKNTDTVYEKLDTMGHTFNTFMDRQARMNLGLSSSITGSGTAVETALYCKILYSSSLGGFDKKLQADILRMSPYLGFSEEALVYDEKVADAATMEKQRTRWIYTYFRYFPVYLQLLVFGIRKMSFNIIYFAFSALRPPLFITIALVFLFALADLFVWPVLSYVLMGVVFLFAASFTVIVLTESKTPGMLQAMLHLPSMVFRQFKALIRIRKASKSFMKTEHVKVMYIEELLKNEPV